MEELSWVDYCAFKNSKGNIIWAAAMQLAWTELRQKFANNHPLVLDTNNPASFITIQKLSSKRISLGYIFVEAILLLNNITASFSTLAPL